jgi:UDP-glucose 4-epimerase
MASGKVLVTGSAGLVGKEVMVRLRARGVAAVGCDLRAPEGNVPEVVTTDICDAERLEQVCREHGVKRAIHLASVLPTNAKRDPKRATEVNIAGSLNVLEAARVLGMQRVVYASSISLYGSTGVRVTEDSPAAPENIYGAGKRYLELLGEAYHRAYGMSFVALRIATVVGPGAQGTASRWRSEIFEALDAAKPVEVTIPYKAEQELPLVHAKEVAEMLVTVALAENPGRSIYNSPAEEIRMEELKRWVEARNPRIVVRFGEDEVREFPTRVDGRRFENEFGFTLQPLLRR